MRLAGVSATEMLQAMLAGQIDPEVLAELARGRMKEKKESLRQALQGKIEEHHRLMLSQLLVDISAYEEQVEEVGTMIAHRLKEQQELLDRLDEIPGNNQRVARTILQICYYMIARGTRYQDLGADYFDRRNPERLAKRLAKRIETLGFGVRHFGC